MSPATPDVTDAMGATVALAPMAIPDVTALKVIAVQPVLPAKMDDPEDPAPLVLPALMVIPARAVAKALKVNAALQAAQALRVPLARLAQLAIPALPAS